MNLHLENLSKGLAELLDSGRFCDVKIQGCDGYVFAHRVVLAAICKAPHIILNESTIVLSEYTANSISTLVRYIYTGELSQNSTFISEEAMNEILNLANYVFHCDSSMLQKLLKNISLNLSTDLKLDLLKPQNDSYCDINSLEASEREESISDGEQYEDLPDEKPLEIPSSIAIPSFQPKVYGSEHLDQNVSQTVPVMIKPEPVVQETSLEKPYQLIIPNDVKTKKAKKEKGMRKQKRKYTSKDKEICVKKKKSDEKNIDTFESGEKSTSPCMQNESSLQTLLIESTQEPTHKRQRKKKALYMYDCSLCTYKCRSKQEKYQHMFRKHEMPLEHQNECRVYNCEICDFQTLISKNFELHKAKHNKDRNDFSCNVCSKSFCHETLLKRHVRDSHRKIDGHLHHCEECDYKTNRKNNLYCHVWNKHKNSKEEYICEICSHKLGNKRYFHCHQYMEHGIPLPKGQTYYSCKYCKFTVPYKGKYLDHLRRHEGDNPFTCEYCGKGFPAKRSLTSHVKWHEDEKKMSCPYQGCQFLTPKKDKLKTHIKNTHESQVS